MPMGPSSHPSPRPPRVYSPPPPLPAAAAADGGVVRGPTPGETKRPARHPGGVRRRRPGAAGARHGTLPPEAALERPGREPLGVHFTRSSKPILTGRGGPSGSRRCRWDAGRRGGGRGRRRSPERRRHRVGVGVEVEEVAGGRGAVVIEEGWVTSRAPPGTCMKRAASATASRDGHGEAAHVSWLA